jgi:hypothetical protein
MPLTHSRLTIQIDPFAFVAIFAKLEYLFVVRIKTRNADYTYLSFNTFQ